jgi:hypothetical protein
MSNYREITVPAFHAVLLLLGLSEGIIQYQSPFDEERYQAFVQKWVKADQFRENDPRQFLQLFGEGLAIFVALPEYVKDATDRGKHLFETPIRQALAVAGVVANTAKIRVNFTENGPVFS